MDGSRLIELTDETRCLLWKYSLVEYERLRKEAMLAEDDTRRARLAYTAGLYLGSSHQLQDGQPLDVMQALYESLNAIHE